MGDKLEFYKYVGLGNDFVVCFDARLSSSLNSVMIRRILDRHTGIGGDGLVFGILGDQDDGSDLQMILFNNDGSRAEISGNGIRCLAHAANRLQLVESNKFAISTDAGMRFVELLGSGLDSPLVSTVSMGKVRYLSDKFSIKAEMGGELWLGTELEIGNPHLVFVPQAQLEGGKVGSTLLSGLDIASYAQQIETAYPNGINIEWLDLMPGTQQVRMRVWERGVGITQACGSGSSASAFFLLDQGIKSETVEVINPGGVLSVSVQKSSGDLLLRGSSSFIARVELADYFFE